MELKPPSIDGEIFSQLLNSNMFHFIEKNCNWSYGYTYTLDMFKTQNNVRQNILEEEKRKQEIIEIEKERKIIEKMKPTNIDEKRKLFAEAALKRMLPKNKKIKSAWVKKAWE